MKKLLNVQGSMFDAHCSRFNVQGSTFKLWTREPGTRNSEPGTLNPEPGTRSPERAARGIALAAAMLFIPVAALSQAINDPTRPPADVAVKAPVVEGVAAPVQQLQSVIISPKRRAAIINGEVVELGGKYGDAVLTRVTEDEVVLKSGESQQVLKLYPAVDKTKSKPARRGRKP